MYKDEVAPVYGTLSQCLRILGMRVATVAQAIAEGYRIQPYFPEN